MNIVHFTHTDLDGYGCGWLMHEFVKTANESGALGTQSIELTQLNSDYHTLSKDLDTLAFDKTIDMLIFTDLNVSAAIVDQLERFVEEHDVRNFVFIDHHISSEGCLERMRHLTPSNNVIVDRSKSATKLLFEYLQETPVTFDKFDDMLNTVNFVNAWDIHDFTNEDIFNKGQFLNDFFFEVKMSIPNGSISRQLERKVLYNIYMLYGNQHHMSADVPCSTIETGLRRVLPRYIFATITREFDIARAEKDYMRGIIDSRGFKQACSLSLAYGIAKQYENSQYTRIYEDSGIKVFIPDITIPMSIVHHLIYTLSWTDVVGIIRPHHKVELRQHNGTPFNLADVAIRCGGGGHRNAAGFPQSQDDNPDRTRSVVTAFLAKQEVHALRSADTSVSS